MIANPNDGNTPKVEQATPQISVSAAGLITATADQQEGYVPGGTKSVTQQLATQGAKTVTPSRTAQTAVASGYYTTGAVQVAGDANLVPENIANGVSIFGVTGTHSGGGGEFITVLVSNDSTINWKLSYVDQNGMFQYLDVSTDSNDKTIVISKGSMLVISNTSPVIFGISSVVPTPAHSFQDGFGSFMDGRGYWTTFLVLSEDTTISL